MKITFTVPGVPVAQPRVKACRRGQRAGVYTPTKTASGKSNGIAEYKAAVRWAAKRVFSGPPLVGATRLDLVFVFPRQSSRVWKTKPMPRYRHIVKPDRDNLEKSVMDALKGLAWLDDCQVCSGTIDKWHAAGGEQPHTLITISNILDES